ncbi:hypothetical protein ID866_5402 [Astraeus odoratus]|nr:hypothetical protein ID866_5402 [Astraeus odoratus]
MRFGKEHLNARNATIHTAYDPNHPPPHPGPQWTRFVCLSDTHSATFDVPPGDVLLHSGDLSLLGKYDHVKTTVDWLRTLPHPVKMQLFNSEETGIVYLQDQKHTFRAKEGGREWSIYGFPWQPWFGGWAFNYRPDEAQALVSAIPEVDILLTHGPPHTILDFALNKQHVGCPELLAHLSNMQRPPLLHCFGHIHESHGAMVHTWDAHPSTETSVDMGASETGETGECAEASVGTDAVQAGLGSRQPRETIMVNAANKPMGAKAVVYGVRVPCGGPGFQPVIVDILDSVQR